MGNFSFLTIENKPVINRCFGVALPRELKYTVYMHLPKCDAYPEGAVFEEKHYGGYGLFGGKDIFVATCELNGITMESKKAELWPNNTRVKKPLLGAAFHEHVFDKLRWLGIDGMYKKTMLRFPVLSLKRNLDADRVEAYSWCPPPSDEMQGDYGAGSDDENVEEQSERDYDAIKAAECDKYDAATDKYAQLPTPTKKFTFKAAKARLTQLERKRKRIDDEIEEALVALGERMSEAVSREERDQLQVRMEKLLRN